MTDTSAPNEPHVIAPAGRLDAAAAAQLRQELAALLAERPARIVVNLSGAHYLSSSILRVLLTAHKRAQQGGGGVALCCVQPHVLSVIKTVGFDQIFLIADDEAEARAMLAESLAAQAPRRARL